MKTKTTDFTLHIPDSEGEIVRRVRIKVPVAWDEDLGVWMMTPEAHRLVEEAKARELGIIMPEEMKAMRMRFGLTQAQMGALLQVGGKSWTRWESGKYRPSRVISLLIRAVADGHLSADYLRGKPLAAASARRPVSGAFEWSRVGELLQDDAHEIAYDFEANVIYQMRNFAETSMEDAA